MRDFWHYWHDNVENSNCTYLIVENIPSCFPHCGIINVSSTKLSTLLIIWNIFSTFLQLNQKIYGDFHKSFRNLPNFFREHARGARAIFHLCFNTRQGGDHEGRQGPSCDLMIHEVILTESTDKDIQLRFHEFSSSVRRQGHNVVLEDKLMKSSKRGMYLNLYVYIPFSRVQLSI